MKNKDYIYCHGISCPLKDRCVRFVEGVNLPDGDWWWQIDCGESRNGFFPVAKK